MSTGEIHPTMKKSASIKGRNVIGWNIRRIRMGHSRKITLEDMAARLALRGVLLDRSAIGRIENNARYVLDYEALAMADALGVEVAALFKKFNLNEAALHKAASKSSPASHVKKQAV
jgi:transcriptional regulator with XRE-family HTH domain